MDMHRDGWKQGSGGVDKYSQKWTCGWICSFMDGWTDRYTHHQVDIHAQQWMNIGNVGNGHSHGERDLRGQQMDGQMDDWRGKRQGRRDALVGYTQRPSDHRGDPPPLRQPHGPVSLQG